MKETVLKISDCRLKIEDLKRHRASFDKLPGTMPGTGRTSGAWGIEYEGSAFLSRDPEHPRNKATILAMAQSQIILFMVVSSRNLSLSF